MTGTWLHPLLKYAWPKPAVDNLLRAAMADNAAAVAAWAAFEATADLDRLPGGEMRLIGLVSKRLPTIAPASPMRPRIAGIERANWSRTQLTVGETARALRALQQGGIEMLIIKGAARLAAGDRLGRGRALNDIDVVVRPAALERAFDILVAEGWQPAGSGSDACQRRYVSTGVGLNFVRGQFGNLDLHQSAFHAPNASPGDDEGIWQRSLQGALASVPIRLPAPTDALAIAIAHGALDAHRSSDWLADAAIAVDVGVEWTLFAAIAGRRRMVPAATIALSYVRERLQRPVPAESLDRLEREAARHPLAALAALIEARPKAGQPGFAWAARGVVKQARLRRYPRLHAPAPVRPRLLPTFSGDTAPSGAARVTEQSLAIDGREPGAAWRGTIDLALSIPAQPAARRIDFEVHIDGRHRERLRAHPFGRRGERIVRFNFALDLAADDSNPVLVAAPSRRFNTDAPAAVVERYAPVPFRVAGLASRRAPPRG